MALAVVETRKSQVYSMSQQAADPGEQVAWFWYKGHQAESQEKPVFQFESEDRS